MWPVSPHFRLLAGGSGALVVVFVVFVVLSEAEGLGQVRSSVLSRQ